MLDLADWTGGSPVSGTHGGSERVAPGSKTRSILASIVGWTLLAIGLGGCSTTTSSPGPIVGPTSAVAIDHFEERALLLLLADRRTYDPITISRALDGPPDLRRQVAYTVARIGDPRGIRLLEGLLGDPAPAVRRAAALGLGLVAGPGSASQNLLGAVNDPDRETGMLAVEALARHGVALEDVVARLIEGPSDELFPRLLPPLFRFRGPAVVRWAVQGLESEDPRLRALAAYALAREPQAEGAEALRGLLDDPDPWVRGWAARALGSVGGRGDLERLRPLLDDSEPGPIVRALNASRSLIAAGHEAAPPSWIPRLLELLTDPRPGVRTTALEVSAVWLLDENLGQALAAFADSPVRRERELALLALAEGGDPRGAALVVRWADDPDPVMRARVAEAAALYGSESLLEQLADDPVAGVRQAALDVRLAARSAEEAEALALRAFDDPDPAVRSTALGWAERNPVVGVDLLAAVTAASRRDRLPDARLAAVGAFEARATSESLERGAAVAELETLATDPEPSVQQAAARALRSLDRDPPTPGPANRKPVDVYRQVIERTASPPRYELVTEKGSFTVALECAEAPLTCLNFTQLASQGFYDGTAWHRVVPDFVVQAGDPRGDGFGGPGYTLRHEPNLLRYDRGVLGMAHSGPGTAGSQFFVTLSPQPHLDGAYVAFGRVVAGDSVLDTLVQGDSILRVIEVPSP